MTAAEIASLIAVLAPVLKEVIIDGTKIAATFNTDMSKDDMVKALGASKSVNWPELSFAPANPPAA